MEKINIAELLKDCPKGMELDCTMFDNVKLIGVDEICITPFPIRVSRGDGYTMTLTKYGQYADADFGKCVIFPKGRTTWEGFVPPCKFKDGDIIYVKSKKCGSVGVIGIYKNESSHLFYDHCAVSLDTGTFYLDNARGLISKNEISISRLATEEEKEKLFDAIKANGYKWNAETKTLEKLIEPKFKVGDKVKSIFNNCQYIITKLTDTHYTLVEVINKFQYTEPIIEDKNWELVPNKFNINTLVPFKSEVLVRHTDIGLWRPAIFGFISDNGFGVVGGNAYKQCIPYKGNEHLMGKFDNCDDFYKTWE